MPEIMVCHIYMFKKDFGDLTYFIDFNLSVILKAFSEFQEYLKNKTNEFYEIVKVLDK